MDKREDEDRTPSVAANHQKAVAHVEEHNENNLQAWFSTLLNLQQRNLPVQP